MGKKALIFIARTPKWMPNLKRVIEKDVQKSFPNKNRSRVTYKDVHDAEMNDERSFTNGSTSQHEEASSEKERESVNMHYLIPTRKEDEESDKSRILNNLSLSLSLAYAQKGICIKRRRFFESSARSSPVSSSAFESFCRLRFNFSCF